jgi:hypothetical protein
MFSRRSFIAGLAGTAFTGLAARADAQMAVFDGAAYVNAIQQFNQAYQQFEKVKIISDNAIKTANQALTTYNEIARQGKINALAIYQVARPYLNTTAARMQTVLQLPQDATNLQSWYQALNPLYHPDQPFVQQMKAQQDETRRQAVASQLLATLEFPEIQFKKTEMGNILGELDTAVANGTASPTDVLHAHAQIAGIQAESALALRATAAQAAAANAAFYDSMLSEQRALRTQPGAAYLGSVLRDLPAQLSKPPVAAPIAQI